MALIFDFDGVLVDSEKSTFVLLQTICARHDIVLPDEALHERVGKKVAPFIDDYFGDRVGSAKRRSVIDEFYDIFYEAPDAYVRPISFVCDFVKSYKGPQKLAIASVGHRRSIDHILESFHLKDMFAVIVSADDVTKLKPDPEVYVMAMALLNESPTDCIAFEDSRIGASAALGAGCAVRIVLNGLNSRAQFEDMPVNGYVSSAADLLRVAQ